MMRLLLCVACVGLPAGCSRQGHNSTNRLGIFVSIPPQKYFAQMVGGDRVEVAALVAPGSSPHTYEPRPSTLRELSKADLYFTVGVEFEKAWVPRVRSSCPGLRVVPTDSGIVKIAMVDAANGHEEPSHEHGGNDPHIWLSPELVRTQAALMCDALSRSDPAHAGEYDSNLRRFLARIDSLQAAVRSVLDSSGTERFMVFHPSWGYFAREFGLTQIPIEVEGKEPSPREMGQIIETAKRLGIGAIFVQPQFSRRAASVIAHDLGCTVAVADPLAGNWHDNLLQFAHALGKK